MWFDMLVGGTTFVVKSEKLGSQVCGRHIVIFFLIKKIIPEIIKNNYIVFKLMISYKAASISSSN